MDHSSHSSHPHVNYLGIFYALCICTALSVLIDMWESLPAPVKVAGVLAIAVAKAGFVMTYFMHLKFEGKWKFIILMPTAILAVGLMVALAPDMALRYYDSQAPQREWRQENPHHGASGGHGEGAAAPHGENAGH